MNSFPLFPLELVVFPEGVLSLRIFEARYLDMVRKCLRQNTTFGIVAAMPVDSNTYPCLYPFATIGTAVSIETVDVPQPGLMNIRCQGIDRFRIISAVRQSDGLWLGEIESIPNDVAIEIPDDLDACSRYLKQIIDAITLQMESTVEIPFAEPFKLHDCAWVANRWCEIMPINIAQKQRMLELDSPLIRLELVQDILNNEFTKKPT